ncbi:MAG TPA: hypothetical protein VFP64_14685 [Pyrinomonadaceae bacterium]|nr:hypothetical protein [Pyrinomonadaceae bacterium]
MTHELRDLLNETKKQLEHLRVLGVEGIRGTAAAPAPAPRLKSTPAPIPTETPAEPLSSLFGDLAPAPVALTPSTETFEQIH